MRTTTEQPKPQVNTAKIGRLRQTLRLSFRKAGAAAGISGSTWHNIESGYRQPSPEVLERIAEVLQVTPESLLHGQGVRQPNTSGSRADG